ncbi:hypothetical protein [Arthrobacter sp. USHLN218]|uniref:hypothetical protein n=1 Tax=Arthrobacter sp. USHLN218 TaxID=3081232 RepID=UPI003015AB19
MFELPLAEGLSVSFQRYPLPASGLISSLPASAGALPCCSTGPGSFLVVLPEGEGCWIGITASGAAAPVDVGVLVRTADRRTLDPLSGGEADQPPGPFRVRVPPSAQVPGISRNDGGWWCLRRPPAPAGFPAVCSLDVYAGGCGRAASLWARFVPAPVFERLGGGSTPPLRPNARYGGWRLP